MAVRLNYPEMLQQVKISLFTGDHSGVYSLACAVACIVCSFALITWYNKMMNDPYGRLDIRAIVRALIVLFLTCNFYTFVLLPFDHITYLVTRGLSASVDEHHGEAYDIKDIIRQVEESRGGDESFLTQFVKEMDKESTQTSADGTDLSFNSSSVLESEAETVIEQPKKTPLGRKIWLTLKDFASARMAMPVYTLGSVVSIVVSALVKIVQWILMAVSSIYLIILGLIGPFAFALSLMPGFDGNIRAWLARYIQISFWTPMAALVDYVNYKLTGALCVALFNAPLTSQSVYSLHLILLQVIVLICLLAVPQLASWVITSAGASDVNRNVAQVAQKAAMIAMK